MLLPISGRGAGVSCGSVAVPDRTDVLAGTLLGTALGDALGLPMEGLSAPTIRRRFGTVDRFHLLGTVGFVSDDTEQSALVAQSLVRHPRDPEACARAFRRSLLGWSCRLPWGVGLATVRASARIALGLRRSGVRSAGNGAAMRSAVVGSFHAGDAALRRRMAVALAEVSHVDPRAVAGGVFVADVAAGAAAGRPSAEAVRLARGAVEEPAVAAAVDRALALAAAEASLDEAARTLGVTGYVVHTVGLASYAFARHGTDTLRAIQAVIAAGGDTDSIAAIVGAWAGTGQGAAALPAALVSGIQDGPFGPTHLRRLAAALAAVEAGGAAEVPSYSAAVALARNLALYPVVLAHGFRRLLPW